MIARTATAEWQGDLQGGEGKIEFGDGRFEEPYSADSRFGDGQETNPEELIAAAHAACYSMALSNLLAEADHEPERIQTEAKVKLGKNDEGYRIASVDLKVEAEVPGITEEEFQDRAEEAKESCPVSKALAGCDIRLEARLR